MAHWLRLRRLLFGPSDDFLLRYADLYVLSELHPGRLARERIRALCGEVIEHLRPSNGAKNKKGVDMKTQHAYNMSSHLYKWFQLFPPRGGSLRDWLFETPPPKKVPKVAKAVEEEEEEAPNPSDEDGSVIV